jgi:acetylornithine deacetylase/succinyl-diaminopimelate desuccinylase-like protein
MVAGRMRDLGFDDVWTDAAGNVAGRIKGQNPGRTVLLATHLDTAAPGDLALWEHDPFGAEMADGWIHGLGAASNKAAIASQVYAAAALRRGTSWWRRWCTPSVGSAWGWRI